MTTVYIPTFAESLRDVEMSDEFLNRIPSAFRKGLMLVIKNGIDGLSGEKKKQQYHNLKRVTQMRGKLPMIVMAANLPLTDLDFYHLQERSIAHISAAIDFAEGLPGRLDNPIVTFHLNTLLAPHEWKHNFDYEGEFGRVILPSLVRCARHAQKKKVSLKIETTPIPEFGDREDVYLNALINPYPVYSKYFETIRSTGIGIALDLCHTYALLKKLGMPHPLTDELRQLQAGDVIHLNDSRGLFAPERHLLHQESVTLGEGEIAELPAIIKTIIQKDYHLVFEIHEDDFIQRPNLVQSLQFFNQYV